MRLLLVKIRSGSPGVVMRRQGVEVVMMSASAQGSGGVVPTDNAPIRVGVVNVMGRSSPAHVLGQAGIC